MHRGRRPKAKPKPIGFWAAYWKVITYLTGSITLVMLAFQLGHYLGDLSASNREINKFVAYVSKIKEGIRIFTISCEKRNVTKGEFLDLQATISSRNDFECDLWLGATIRSPSRKEFWNAAEDQVVTAAPNGLTTIKRRLTIQADTPSDKYDLIVNIWYGKLSDPIHSMLISSSVLVQAITVRN